MPRFINWLGPLAGLALLGAEAGIAVAGIWFPRVDSFYQDYYITHTRSCWLPAPVAARAEAGLRRGDIIIAVLNHPESCFLLMRGWTRSDAAWAVTSLAVANLEFPTLPNREGFTLALASLNPGIPQPVGIFVDGAFAREVTLPGNPGFAPVEIPLPAGIGGDVFVALHLHNSGRTRRVGLLSVTWKT